MKIIKIMLIVVFVSIFLASSANAEKIIAVELVVFQNDTVTEKTINVTEGIYSQYWKTGDYTLEFLDKDKKLVGRQSIDIFFGYSGPVVLGAPKPDDNIFDSFYLNYKYPYNKEIQTFVLRHFDAVIFSKDIGCVDCIKDIAEDTANNYILVFLSLIAIFILLIIFFYYKKRRETDTLNVAFEE